MRPPSNKESGGLLAFRQPSSASCSELSCSGGHEKAEVPKSLQHRNGGLGSKSRNGKRRSSSFTEGEEGEESVPVNIPEDGYFWLKYGEKMVRHSEGSPLIRSYFRCGEQHNGRACRARKTINWDVGVRPVNFDVSYMFAHCHPPSDNPRQSIRPMRKLRIPGFATRPTGFIQPLGTKLSPRHLSCPDLSHLLRESPASPWNSSQSQETNVSAETIPATPAPLRSASISTLPSLYEQHEPFPPPARSQTFASFDCPQAIPDFSACTPAGPSVFSGQSVPFLMAERDVDAHAFHASRVERDERQQLLPKEERANCNLEVLSDPWTAAAAENSSQWQLDFLEEILALHDPIHHPIMPHVLTSELESLGRIDSNLQGGEAVPESMNPNGFDMNPARSVSHAKPSRDLGESTGWFRASPSETMGLTSETCDGPYKLSAEGTCAESPPSSPTMPSPHLYDSTKPVGPAATGVGCDGSLRRERQSEPFGPRAGIREHHRMAVQSLSTQQHFNHHQLVSGSTGTTYYQGAGRHQEQQQQQQRQRQQMHEQQKQQQQQHLWPEKPQILGMEEQNNLQQQLLQLLLNCSANLPQQHHLQKQHQQQRVQKVEPVCEQPIHVPSVEAKHGRLSRFPKVGTDFDQLIQTVRELQVGLVGSKTPPAVGDMAAQCLDVALQAVCLHHLLSEVNS